MLINRRNVEKELSIVLKWVNAKRKIKDVIVGRFQERGFLNGEAIAIITGTNPLSQLTDEVIYLLVWILYHNIDNDELKSRIVPEKILTEKEFNIAKTMRINRKTDSIYPIIFRNIHQDADDDYSGIITLQQLSELFDNRIIKYNPETQRPLVSKLYHNQEVKEIFLNKRNTKEIEEKILSGKQIPDEITFNIAAVGNEDFEFISSRNELKMNDGDLFCINGWHRITGGRNAFKKDPEKCGNFYYKLRIVHWDIDKAKAYVYQESLGTRLDLLATKSYNVYDEINQVITKLNENPKSCLQGKITTDKSKLESGKAVILFNVLFDIISHLFNIKNNQDVSSTSNYLRDAFNLISDDMPGLLKKQLDDRFLTAYLILMKRYQNDENWKNNLMQSIDKLNGIDLQSVYYTKVGKNFITEIEKYIIEKGV